MSADDGSDAAGASDARHDGIGSPLSLTQLSPVAASGLQTQGEPLGTVRPARTETENVRINSTVRAKRFIGLISWAEYLEESAQLKAAAGAFLHGEYSTAHKLYRALSGSPFVPVRLESAIMLPTLYGAEGESEKAVEGFNALLPMVRKAGLPILAGHYFNNFAVELIGAGELDGAAKASAFACSVPGANPEWFVTARDVVAARGAKARAHATVVVHRPGDLLEFDGWTNRQTREADFNRILECAVGLCPVRMRKARRAVEAV